MRYTLYYKSKRIARTDNVNTLLENLTNSREWNGFCGITQNYTLAIDGEKHTLVCNSPLDNEFAYTFDGENLFNFYYLRDKLYSFIRK